MTRIGLAAASLAMAATLSACGGDSFTDQSGDQIAEDAKSAMSDLTAVKVAGTMTSDAEEITLDVQSNSDGDCIGSISVGAGSAEIIGVGGEAWFRPDEAFWTETSGDAAAEILEIVGDNWVVVPPDEDGFRQFCDLDEFLDELLADEDDDSEATFTVGDTSDLDGDEVVAVDREDEDGKSTAFVRTDDPHHIVRIERTEGEDTGSVTFSEFDEEFEVEAPPAEQVVDFSTLAG